MENSNSRLLRLLQHGYTIDLNASFGDCISLRHESRKALEEDAHLYIYADGTVRTLWVDDDDEPINIKNDDPVGFDSLLKRAHPTTFFERHNKTLWDAIGPLLAWVVLPCLLLLLVALIWRAS